MSQLQSVSARQGPLGAGRFLRNEPLRIRLSIAAIVVVLALLALALRLHRLHESPLGLGYDESAHGMDALRVLQGEHALFFPRNYGREGMIVYATALTTSLFGRTVLALRLPTALVSSATVLVVFWLGEILFGRNKDGQATPWRGLVIGGAAAGLVAISGESIWAGRLALRAPYLPLFLSLSLALLWDGWRRGSLWRVALAGISAGLTPYTYIAARFVPILLLLFGLSFLLPFRSVTRSGVRAAIPLVSVYLALTALVAAPILIHFSLHPDHFVMRSKMVWIFLPEHSSAGALSAFLNRLWDHRYAFDFQGGPSSPDKFLLRPWEALFFWSGAIVALWRWRQGAAYRLLLLWSLVLLFPSFLAAYQGPNFLRMMGAVPAIYLLVGVGIWETLHFVKQRLPSKLASLSAVTVTIAASGLILVQGAAIYQGLSKLGKVKTELPWHQGVPWLELAQTLNAQPSEPGTVYLIPTYQHDWNFKYLYHGSAPAYTIDPGKTDFAKRVEAVLAAEEPVSLVKVVEWKDRVHWMGEDSEQFAVLLNRYGRFQGSEEHSSFLVHSFADISLNRPWSFYEDIVPQTVEYDGGIALKGLALGQGEEQIAAPQILELQRDRPMWLAMQWQITQEVNIDYSISLRLYSENGERVFQEDAVLRDRIHRPTNMWPQEGRVDTLHTLTIPTDLPPGEYEFRSVVYNFETEVPTVQIGTWQPEVTLARLRLRKSQ